MAAVHYRVQLVAVQWRVCCHATAFCGSHWSIHFPPLPTFEMSPNQSGFSSVVRNKMEDFKVSVESLHTTRIKEITYEGEEIYQERPTLSQRLTELAQRIDFSESLEGEGSEPATKKPTQKWPWEYTHSKLKQALTEISVLSDVLQILQNHRNYVVMDPVMAQPTASVTPGYQYIVTKKALGVAAGILRRGTESLSKVSSHGEREFHKALSSLRQRWRLRRTPQGTIVGDLSYLSAGSQYAGVVTFEVQKGEGLEGKSGKIISVTIPRELRGRSQIAVFLSKLPVKDVPSLDLLHDSPFADFSKKHRTLPSWELKLVAAQNVLFNQELFSQLAREAYDQKTVLPHEVFTNRINIPLSQDYWLSILHIREYGDEIKTEKAPVSLPPVRWSLVVTLKQLLRENHHHTASLNSPHPATANFNEAPEMRNAGVVPLKATQLKQLSHDDNIFNRFFRKAKHMYNEERLQQWLVDLCSSCNDPILSVIWVPDIAFTSATAKLQLTDPPSKTPSCSLQLRLGVDEITVQQIEGKTITFPLEKQKLLRILKHQVVVHLMQLACQIAERQQWMVLQRFTHPLLSHTLASSSGDYMEACSIVLESSDAHKKVNVLLEWDKVSVNFVRYASEVTTTEDIAAVVPKSQSFVLGSHFGHGFQQRFTNMLTSISSTQ